MKPQRTILSQRSMYTCSLKPDLENIKWYQIVIITWTRRLLQLFEDTFRIIIWSRHKKGLSIFSKRQIVRFIQFTAWCQHILRERVVLFRCEAKLCCILNRCINHLVGQLDRTLHRLHLVEHFARDFVVITSTREARPGKGIFKPQAELIYKVCSKTYITVRLLPGQNDLYQSQIIRLPVGIDPAFVKRKLASATNNGLRGYGHGSLLMRLVL